jgi:diguanylate cyclase (GGDEF)-like protein
MVLAALIVVMVASAVPNASTQAREVINPTESSAFAPVPLNLDPHTLGGAGALVVTGLLLLLFLYRRRLYILIWVGGWVLLAASMLVASRTYSTEQARLLAYGVSQFLGILSALTFVLSVDAYPGQPRLDRNYTFVLVPLFLWFALAPLGLNASAVFAPGHVLMAGALAAAGVAYLVLLRQTRMVGAAVLGVSLLLISASHVWTVLRVASPNDPGATSALLFRMIPYLVTALGMQLMTFEDMTLELRRTNRRLENAQSKLRRAVITDPLTGCRNRRFFDEIIGRELRRHERHGIPLSLMFIDINRFKAVNDQLGHDVGDQVLQQVAAFLLANIREADYVFRWGGDEFLVLISCGEQEARARGAALQRAFMNAPETRSLPAGVGLSIGCVEVGEKVSNILSLVKIADDRMYADKRRQKAEAPEVMRLEKPRAESARRKTHPVSKPSHRRSEIEDRAQG